MTVRRLFLATAMCAALCAGAVAQNLRRPSPQRHAPRVTAAAAVSYDTVTAPPADTIAVAGFEKLYRATRETMFVTNHSSRPVTTLGLDITYRDLSGRMLHRAVSEVQVAVPAGETRRVSVPSFDSSGLFYYRLSPRPVRAAQATPFDVEVKVTYITHPFLTPEK